MRLSEWLAKPPNREAANPKVVSLIEPVLSVLGAEPDPHCWAAWGDDSAIRWSLLVPTTAGLIACYVRVNVAGEGPRLSAKVTRWSRVQLGDLAVETQGNHRLLSFQVEQTVMRGADEVADEIAAFALVILAAVEGRPIPDLDKLRPRRKTTRPAKAATKPLRPLLKAGPKATASSGAGRAAGRAPTGA
jgi:hypothetical protein